MTGQDSALRLTIKYVMSGAVMAAVLFGFEGRSILEVGLFGKVVLMILAISAVAYIMKRW